MTERTRAADCKTRERRRCPACEGGNESAVRRQWVKLASFSAPAACPVSSEVVRVLPRCEPRRQVQIAISRPPPTVSARSAAGTQATTRGRRDSDESTPQPGAGGRPRCIGRQPVDRAVNLPNSRKIGPTSRSWAAAGAIVPANWSRVHAASSDEPGRGRARADCFPLPAGVRPCFSHQARTELGPGPTARREGPGYSTTFRAGDRSSTNAASSVIADPNGTDVGRSPRPSSIRLMKERLGRSPHDRRVQSRRLADRDRPRGHPGHPGDRAQDGHPPGLRGPDGSRHSTADSSGCVGQKRTPTISAGLDHPYWRTDM